MSAAASDATARHVSLLIRRMEKSNNREVDTQLVGWEVRCPRKVVACAHMSLADFDSESYNALRRLGAVSPSRCALRAAEPVHRFDQIILGLRHCEVRSGISHGLR